MPICVGVHTYVCMPMCILVYTGYMPICVGVHTCVCAYVYMLVCAGVYPVVSRWAHPPCRCDSCVLSVCTDVHTGECMYVYLFVLACMCRPVCMSGGQKLMIRCLSLNLELASLAYNGWLVAPGSHCTSAQELQISLITASFYGAAGKPNSYLHVVQQALDSLSYPFFCLSVCLPPHLDLLIFIIFESFLRQFPHF